MFQHDLAVLLHRACSHGDQWRRWKRLRSSEREREGEKSEGICLTDDRSAEWKRGKRRNTFVIDEFPVSSSIEPVQRLNRNEENKRVDARQALFWRTSIFGGLLHLQMRWLRELDGRCNHFSLQIKDQTELIDRSSNSSHTVALGICFVHNFRHGFGLMGFPVNALMMVVVISFVNVRFLSTGINTGASCSSTGSCRSEISELAV